MDGNDDAVICRKCGTKMEYQVAILSQLDWFECPYCGEKVYPQAEEE